MRQHAAEQRFLCKGWNWQYQQVAVADGLGDITSGCRNRLETTDFKGVSINGVQRPNAIGIFNVADRLVKARTPVQANVGSRALKVIGRGECDVPAADDADPGFQFVSPYCVEVKASLEMQSRHIN